MLRMLNFIQGEICKLGIIVSPPALFDTPCRTVATMLSPHFEGFQGRKKPTLTYPVHWLTLFAIPLRDFSCSFAGKHAIAR